MMLILGVIIGLLAGFAFGVLGGAVAAIVLTADPDDISGPVAYEHAIAFPLPRVPSPTTTFAPVVPSDVVGV